MSELVQHDMAPARIDHPLAGMLRYTGMAFLALTVLNVLAIRIFDANSFAEYLFVNQDRYLLLVSGLALIASSFLVPDRGAGVTAWGGGKLAMAIGAAAVFAYIGSHLIMESYALSRDEQLADFAAQYLAKGQLGRPVPRGLRDLATAIMPLWSDRWVGSGYWVSNYLPVNSLFRAGAIRLGDAALTGPALLAIGAFGIWSTARQIWPARRDLATVAVVLALTSTQVLATAMTPYAMSGHFALSALWMACAVRGGRLGHGAALFIGFWATGLHQYHYHPLFVSGFIAWYWLSGHRKTALLYAVTCCLFVVFWYLAYPALINAALGTPPNSPGGDVQFIGARLQSYVHRLGEVKYLPYLAKFVAWQNILLAPLALLGARAAFDDDRKPTIFFALSFSCAVGLAMMVDQVHGWGVRYLHGLIPCFCLLAAAGWLRLEQRMGRQVPGILLWGSAAFALLVTAPIALWGAKDLVHGYAQAYRTVRGAPADVVLVDTRDVGFLQDIVRLDGPLRSPLILDLAYVPAERLGWLCRNVRVMTFDRVQSKALGLLQASEPKDKHYMTLAARRRWMSRRGCGSPVTVAMPSAT